MRKTMMTMGLGVALLLGGTGVASAQATNAPERQPRAERQDGQAKRGERGEHGARGQRGPGRMDAMLFRGIELTDAQRQRVQALNAEFARGAREGMGPRGERPAGAARGERGMRGDGAARGARGQGARPATPPTAEQRAALERRRTEGEARREQHVAQLRAILTPAQRTVFDRNVAALQAQREARAAERGQPGARGEGRPGAGRGRAGA